MTTPISASDTCPAVTSPTLHARHSFFHIRLRHFLSLATLLLLPLLAACQPSTIGTNAVGYNHRDQGIVYSVNGQAGAYVHAHEGGGGFSCCVSIPAPWQPGLTATVKWRWGGTQEWFEETVPVPEYKAQEIGSMSVHFLRNGEIKVYVTMYALRHPDYPLKGPEAALSLPSSSHGTP